MNRKSILTSAIILAGILFISATGAFANPVFTIQNKKDACNGLSNGSFEILVTSGNGSLTGFVFSSGAPIGPISLTSGVPFSVTGLAGQTGGKPYLVIVSDNDGTSVNNVFINLFPDVSATVASITNSVSCATPNGAININVSGGSGTYGYSWTATNGFTANTQDISGLSAGDYTVVITDPATVCSKTIGPISITEPAPPASATLNLIGASPICNIIPSSKLSVVIVGGTSPYTVSISGLPVINSYVSGNAIVVNPTTTTSYSLLGVTDASGCASLVLSGNPTVTVNQPVNAGSNNSVLACNNEASFNLFNSLAGTPDVGGTWLQLTGPSSRTITGNTVDLNGAVPGVYTFQYTVVGAAPCPNATAVVSVSVTAASNAGLNNAVNACNTESSFNLFASLAGTPQTGGTWSQLTGPARTVTGNTVNLNGAAVGGYTFEYRVTGTTPCPDATAVVTVNVIAAPNAGTSNSVNACNIDPAFNLFTSLGGTPDSGGSWTQLSGAARTITGNTVNLNGAVAGTYTFQYQVIGTAPCANATAVVTVNVIAAPNAGIDNSANACNTDAAFNLFGSLGGTPQVGGTWTQLTGPARTITGNTVNLNGAAVGGYTFEYRVTGTTPCPDATAVVTVNVIAAPNAGTSNSVNACNIDPVFNLFASLGGTPDSGGSWTQLSGTVRTITGNTVDLNGAVAGTYTFQYQVIGAAPCANATAVVTVNVNSTPNAGVNNSVNGCNNDAAFNLFASLGGSPVAGGTWTQLSGASLTIAGNSVNLVGAAAGVYTFEYRVTAIAPCADGTAIVTVNVIEQANAGTDNTVNACSNDSAFNLFTSLGGTPQTAGLWTQLTGSIRTITGNTVDLNGAAAGAYTFEYRVTGTIPCADATAVVTVNVSSTPNPGVNNTVAACNNESAFDLFTSIGGTPQPGGTWTQLTGGSLTITGNTVNLVGATSGTYDFQYTVTGVAPCPAASSVVTINISELANAGANNTVAACNNDPVFNLFSSLGGTPQTGGTWLQLTGATRTITGNTVDLNGASSGAYTFEYRISGTSICPDAVAIVTVNVNSVPNAGLDNSVSACNTETAFNLLSNLLGSPQAGGIWTQLSGSSLSISGNAVDLTGATAGIYTFQYNVAGLAPCPVSSSVLTVNVVAAPNAGSDNSAQACNTDSAFNLFANLGGTPQSGGVWTQLSGSTLAITGNTVDFIGASAGTYTFQYSVAGTSPCATATSVVTVELSANPDVSLNIAVLTSPVCLGGSTDIVITNSELGVTYQLRDDSNDAPVGASVAGTGGAIILPTGSLNSNAAFNVLAIRGSCSVQMTQVTNVTVSGVIDGSKTVTPVVAKLCEGSSTDIQILSSESGIQYQLRDDSDNSPVGSSVSGTGGTIILSTDVLMQTTTFNILAFSPGFCSIELNNKATIQVDVNPDPNLTVSSLITTLCTGGATSVTVANSQNGVSYQLRDNSDNSLIGSAVVGDSGLLELSTGSLSSTKTFNVLATSGVCVPTQLAGTVAVIVAGTIDLSLNTVPVNSQLCAGSGTDIEISNSEVGVNYQLVDDSDGTLVGVPVAGSGSIIKLPTGQLSSSKIFRIAVSNGVCSAELISAPSVSVTPLPSNALDVTSASPSVCSGTSASIQVVNSESGVIYQLRDDADDSNISGAAIGNGATLTLPAGILTVSKTYNVLATAGSCSIELVDKVTIGIDPAPSVSPDLAAQSAQVCSGNSTFIQVLNSELGIIYQLRDNSDNSIVSGAVFGNGSTINLPTGPINADRTFNVTASNSICTTQLTEIVAVTVRAFNDPACSNCSSVIITTNTTKVTCGATIPDGTVTFLIDPPVPTVDIIGVRIQISGPLNKTQTNDLVFTELAVGNYTYTVTYGDENNPDCIKSGVFTIEAVREPDPITFDVAIDEYNCNKEIGSITLSNIQGAGNTDFIYVVINGTSNITQGVITSTQSSSTIQIGNLLIGDYDIVLSQNQEAANGCLGTVNSLTVPFSIQEPLGGCDIYIPNIFTPNGDGSNDTFFIRHKPDIVSLVITNRWGKEVYSSSDYKNDWTGESVSDGVYYYKIIAEAKSYTGWIEILR